MNNSKLDTFFRPVAARLHANHMSRLGIATTMRSSKGAYRSYTQDICTPEDLEIYPSFLDFATSSDALSVVSHYLQSIPALSTTLPPGIRVMESNAAFDDQPDNPRDSQLYHIDY